MPITIIPQPEPARQHRRAKAHDWPISNIGVGRQSHARRDRRFEHIRGEFGCAGEDAVWGVICDDGFRLPNQENPADDLGQAMVKS